MNIIEVKFCKQTKTYIADVSVTGIKLTYQKTEAMVMSDEELKLIMKTFDLSPSCVDVISIPDYYDTHDYLKNKA